VFIFLLSIQHPQNPEYLQNSVEARLVVTNKAMSLTIFSVDAFRAVLANADRIKNPHSVYGHFHGESIL
jgi:hypothetical protein